MTENKEQSAIDSDSSDGSQRRGTLKDCQMHID